MSTAPIQVKRKEYPIEAFYSVDILSGFISDIMIENLLRFDNIDNWRDFEREAPTLSEDVNKEVIKILQECISTESNEPIQNAIDIVNIMDTNSELLTISDLISITRIKEFSNAYPIIFDFHCKQMDING